MIREVALEALGVALGVVLEMVYELLISRK